MGKRLLFLISSETFLIPEPALAEANIAIKTRPDATNAATAVVRKREWLRDLIRAPAAPTTEIRLINFIMPPCSIQRNFPCPTDHTSPARGTSSEPAA